MATIENYISEFSTPARFVETEQRTKLFENNTQNQGCCLKTSAYMKTRGAKILAALALTFAVGITGAVAIGFLATPLLSVGAVLLVVAGTLFYVSSRYYEYNTHTKIQSYRDEALIEANESIYINKRFHDNEISETPILKQIAAKHSYENMFYYGIPLPEEFNEIYQNDIARMSIAKLIPFYEEITQAYEAVCAKYPNDHFIYHIPQLSEQRAKFRKESVDVELKEFFKLYDLDSLLRYDLITSKECDNLKILKMDFQYHYGIFRKNTSEFDPMREDMTLLIERSKNEYIHAQTMLDRSSAAQELEKLEHLEARDVIYLYHVDTEKEKLKAQKQRLELHQQMLAGSYNLSDSTRKFIQGEEKSFDDSLQMANDERERAEQMSQQRFAKVREKYEELLLEKKNSYAETLAKYQTNMENVNERQKHFENVLTHFKSLDGSSPKAEYDKQLLTFRRRFVTIIR